MRYRIIGTKVAGSLAMCLIAAVLGAVCTTYFSKRATLSLTIKQQDYALVQQFNASGQQVNTAFQAFNDALVDAQEARRSNTVDLRAARKALRDSIAQHSSQAYSMQRVLGPDALTYVRDLARFRNQVDQTTSPADAMPMAQMGMDLIAARQKLSDDAVRRSGLTPT